MIKINVILVLLFALSGCSSVTLPPLNEPLSARSQQGFRGVSAVAREKDKPIKKSDELTLILTFSGGGTRAAAFSYGVLKELESVRMKEGNGKTLLDEVDLISSVSGGSFTSAYYGLYGKRIFTDFEQLFLKRPVQSSLLKYLLLSPSNWIKLAPSLYERSDLAADYYADTIFGNKRYRDFRREGPRIVINATDLASGQGFAFTKKNFQRLCSEIGSYPVGRAVVASSAVPVVFSPIVMKNYTADCNDGGVRTSADLSRFETQNRNYKSFLHLVDGGVVDNLGIRSLIHIVEENDNNFWALMKTHKMTQNHKVVFIIVNASDAIPPSIGQKRQSPTTTTTLGAVTTIQSKRYNQETLLLLQSLFPKWQRQVQKGRCIETNIKGCADIEFQMAELNFNQLSSEQAQQLSLLETSLELPAEQVDQLIDAGRKLLRQSPLFHQLLNR